MVKILDCTTRDGGHITNWEYEEAFVFEHIKCLNNYGVTYYEIGYRNYYDTQGKGHFYKCDAKFLKKFYSVKGDLQIGVMTDTKRYNEVDFYGADNDFLDFVRVASHPDKISETLDIAYNLYKKGYKVFVQLMDVSNIQLEGYLALYNWEHKNILESIYIADSYGILYPEDIEKYYYKLKSLGYEKISFHAHNKIGNAYENTIKAIDLGVYSVDATFNGVGRCGGNLNLNELLRNIKPCIK